MYPLSIALLIHDDDLCQELHAALRSFPCRLVADLRDFRSMDAAISRITRCKPDVAFVELREDQKGADLFLPDLKESADPPVLVALHRSPTIETVVSALRAGANEFLQPPIQENLNAFINRTQHGFRARSGGKVVGFISAKGGCGSTTVACHAAVEVARLASKEEKRALLMDLDLTAGLAGFLMKVESEYSVVDAVHNLQRLDIDYWSKLVGATHAGLDVLGALIRSTAKQPLDWDQVQSVIGFARRHYAWTMLDLGKGFGQEASAVLPEVDQVLVVATREVGSLHGARKLFQALEDAGYPKNRARLVLNRVAGSAKNAVSEVESALGVPVSFTLTEDSESLLDCYASGRLLSGRKRLAADLQHLAARIVDETEPPKPRRSLITALTACTSWISQ